MRPSLKLAMRNQKTLFSDVLLTLMLASLVVSCGRNPTSSAVPTTKAMAENQKREKLGLRQVKTIWYLYRTEFGAEDWKLKESDNWGSKRIQRDSSGKLLWEEDYYYSGKTFMTDKGQDWEMLTVHFDYGSGAFAVSYVGQDTTMAALLNKVAAHSTATEKLAVADEILKKWGMTRL